MGTTWIAVLLAIVAGIPGYLAFIATRSQQKASVRLEERKVDQEAFEIASRRWQSILDRADAEAEKKDKRIDELERLHEIDEAEKEKLKAEIKSLRDMIMQMRGALVAAGIPLPEEKP